MLNYKLFFLTQKNKKFLKAAKNLTWLNRFNLTIMWKPDS